MGDQMDSTGYESNIEALRAFKSMTGGAYLRVRPFEIIEAIVQRDADNIVVKLITFELDERKTEMVLKAKGTKLVGYKRTESGSWVQNGKAFTVWDDTFSPISVKHYGPGKTEAEYWSAKAYDRLCYRPGSDRQPMDSFRRVVEGYTPARMERHW